MFACAYVTVMSIGINRLHELSADWHNTNCSYMTVFIMKTRNTLDCDQSNVYSSRVIFSSISPNLPFRSFSLYRWSAGYPPLRNKCPSSCHASTVITESDGKVWSVYIYTQSESDNAFQRWPFDFFPRWPPAAILDLIQPKMSPFDPPSPKTAPQNQTRSRSVDALQSYGRLKFSQNVWMGPEVGRWSSVGRSSIFIILTPISYSSLSLR